MQISRPKSKVNNNGICASSVHQALYQGNSTSLLYVVCNFVATCPNGYYYDKLHNFAPYTQIFFLNYIEKCKHQKK